MHNKETLKGQNLWLAIGLIFIGFIFLLDNLNLIHFGDLWRFWPVIFIALGLLKLTSSDTRSRNSAYFLLGFGLLFLLSNFHVLELETIWSFWPLILILIGVSIIYRKTRPAPESPDFREGGTENRIDIVAIFGGNEKKVASSSFEGGNMTMICGGAKLDLGAAELAEGNAVIDFFAICGGAEIFVPADWNVELSGMPIFGGFEDGRRKLPDSKSPSNKTLLIKGLILFGGLQIKNA